MQNRFGETIYLIPELAADTKLMEYISKSLRNLFEYIGFNGAELEQVLKETLSSFGEEVLRSNSRPRGTETEYDLPVHLLDFYDKIGFREKRKKRIQGRAKAMFDLVRPYITEGETILDIGTGNSSVALEFHNAGYTIYVMDITDNRSDLAKEKESQGLEFSLHGVNEPLKYQDNSYDASLTVATLHHCDDPIRLLNELIRVSRRKLIIYESTFGVSRDDMPDERVATNPQLYGHYLGLNREQQKMYGTFLDWFLNKVEFRNDAHVPCNFTSPDRWEKIFGEKGLAVQDRRLLGFDNPGISEFHILYVLEKS